MPQTRSKRPSLAELLDRAPAQPNWPAWQKVSSAPLWELVALSVDIEPYSIRGWEQGISRRQPPPLFHENLRVLESKLSINGGPIPSQAEGEFSRDARIDLGTFRSWCIELDIGLPNSFPVIEGPKPLFEDKEARKNRLTLAVQEKKKHHKNFMKIVAGREGISTQRLAEIVGSPAERARTLEKLKPLKPLESHTEP